MFPLLSILVTGCDFVAIQGEYTYANPEKYGKLVSEITLDNITGLDVDWISGTIRIGQDNEAQGLTIYEENAGNYQLYYCVENGTLNVKFSESGIENKYLNEVTKNLYITLPASFSEIKIHSVGSNIYFSEKDDIKVDNLSVFAVDGRFRAGNYFGRKTKIQTTGCEITYNSVAPLTENGIHTMSIMMVGEDAEIGIAEEVGYDVEFESSGGFFSSEYGKDERGEYYKKYPLDPIPVTGEEVVPVNRQISIDFTSTGSDLIIKKVVEEEKYTPEFGS